VTEAAILTSRTAILERIAEAFRQRDPYYDFRWPPLDARRRKLNKTLADLLKQGHPMECALQRLYEAKWLINYTDDWTSAEAALDGCERSVQEVNQPRVIQADDGSWGPCCREWYRKLEPTIDALQEREAATDPLKPLAFMSVLQKPENLTRLLQAVSVSDIVATGRNCRDEQNALLTAFGQLIFKDGLRKLLVCRAADLKFEVSKDLEKAFEDHLWGLQHKDTGYWGPSYQFGNELVTVPDLSYTFHIVHYYMDGTNRIAPGLKEMVATTLAIKDGTYPNGWYDKGKVSTDHNNYDVVTLFDCGWKKAPDYQDRMRKEIQELLTWCLTKSLQYDQFGTDRTIDSYYYGVRFLDRVGFWDKAKRFWRDDDIPLPPDCPSPETIRQRLLLGFKFVDDGSEYCETVTQILTGWTLPPDACGRT
jgi:hypothetical protein